MEEIISLTNDIPTAFHYVAFARKLLTESGFVEVKEEEEFNDVPSKFFVCRDEQTILAFNIYDTKCGKFLSTSLDYPTLKIQPNSGRFHHHCEQVNTFLYGKGMWITWPDRDLTVAGRAFIRDKSNNQITQKLVYSKVPVAEIPMLAVHLKPGSGIRTELEPKHLRPVLNFIERNDGNEEEEFQPKQSPTLMKIIAKECECEVDDVVNYDLSFISAEPSKVIGVNDELLSSQRISSILTSIIALKEYINHYGNDNKPYAGLACFYAYTNDQESNSSRTGPNSNFLESILKRIGINVINNNFFASSSLYGIKNTSSNLNQGGISTFSDQLGNFHFSYEFAETTLNTLKKNKINATRVNSSKLSIDGAASIGKKFNLPTFIFGISIGGIFSIRETAFLKDLENLKEVIDILLK